MKLSGTGVLAVAALIGAGVVVALLWKYRDKFNPASDQNLAYKGAGSVVAAATGGAEATVGGAIARVREWLSGDTSRIEAMKRGAPAGAFKSKAKATIAPANDLSAELAAGAPYVWSETDTELRGYRP